MLNIYWPPIYGHSVVPMSSHPICVLVVGLDCYSECAPHRIWWTDPFQPQKPLPSTAQPTNEPENTMQQIQQLINTCINKSKLASIFNNICVFNIQWFLLAFNKSQLKNIKFLVITVIQSRTVVRACELNNMLVSRARGPSSLTRRHLRKTSQYPR